MPEICAPWDQKIFSTHGVVGACRSVRCGARRVGVVGACRSVRVILGEWVWWEPAGRPSVKLGEWVRWEPAGRPVVEQGEWVLLEAVLSGYGLVSHPPILPRTC